MSKELTKLQIEELKKIYGPLHKITIGEDSFIFRTMNRVELKRVGIFDKEYIEPEDEELIYNMCVLYPSDLNLDNMPSGVITGLVQSILDKSGATDETALQDALEKARARTTVFTDIASHICMVFPTILPQYLDELPLDNLMDLFVIAEDIMLKTGELDAPVSFGVEGEDVVSQEDKSAPRSEAEMARMLQEALIESKNKGLI